VTEGVRLPRRLLARPSTVVAPSLLGCVLVRILPDGRRLSVRIVETEAYEQGDPASHSYRGRTARTEVMFGPAGHLYVYFTYGMHFCANVVTGRRGEGSAVLLRAGEPLEGLDIMAERRGTSNPRRLCSGPARLCQALCIDRAAGGEDLVAGERIWLERGTAATAISAGPRVGIRRAMEQPWRFWETGDPFVSRAREGRDVEASAPSGEAPVP
jgi:DNA-3-methyladenine glycosylase